MMSFPLREIGREAAARYGVRLVPSVLVFDGAGNLVQRSEGLPNAGVIREAALALPES